MYAAFKRFLQVPRRIKGLYATPESYLFFPPVLCNSIPKSGTHLLLQILEVIPGISNYGTQIMVPRAYKLNLELIYSTLLMRPKFSLKEETPQVYIRWIKQIIPGEVVFAHLLYQPEFIEELAKKNCIHYFIYRDPRDVVISDVFFITFLSMNHTMHDYFAKTLNNMNERISAGILGADDPKMKNNYPSIVEQFEIFRGWLECNDVFAVKYEDLVSGHRNKILQQMAAFYLKHSNSKLDIDDLAQRMETNINPNISRTFRKGEVGGWKQAFTQNHKDQMKEVAGKLLIDLGYEKDDQW